MRSVLMSFALVLCLFGLVVEDATADHTIWHSPLKFATWETSLTIASSPQSASIHVTSDQTGSKWIDLGLLLPSNVAIDSVTVCYELADPATFITQVRLTRMTTPDQATVLQDDPTDLNEVGAACYTTVLGSASVIATTTLSLHLVYADVAHWIEIGGIAVHVSDSSPLWLSGDEMRPDGKGKDR